MKDGFDTFIVAGIMKKKVPLVVVTSQQFGPDPGRLKGLHSPMDGFETYLKAAQEKKEVPLVVVEDKDKADFEITGASESHNNQFRAGNNGKNWLVVGFAWVVGLLLDDAPAWAQERRPPSAAR